MIPGSGLPTRRPLLALLVVSCLLAAPACKKKKDGAPALEGNGVAKTEARSITSFTSLQVGGIVQATYTVGSPRLELHGDANLLPEVQAEVAAGRLALTQKQTLKPSMTLSATIAGPELEEIIAAMASRVTVQGIHAKHLVIRGGGAAKLTVTGSAEDIDVSAEMASQLDLSGLSVGRARVSAATAARVYLGYVEELDVETRAAARVSYTGDPKIARNVGRGASKRR
jgi:hypothetical protein